MLFELRPQLKADVRVLTQIGVLVRIEHSEVKADDMALTGDVEVSHLKANVVALKVMTESSGHSDC